MQQEIIMKNNLLNKEDLYITGSLSVLYLVISYILIGFKSDQISLILICNFLYYFSTVTRKFIIGFSIFVIFWILYDYLKAFPNYLYNTVHILDLYHWEKDWFGFVSNGELVTPNEYRSEEHTSELQSREKL